MCGKSLATPNSFRNHLRTHTNDKPFECSVCGKKFGRNHHLQDHLVTHTKEKPHICSRCGKAFTQRAPLLRHMKCVHETARPYQCLICSKSFATKSLVNSHAKLHNVVNWRNTRKTIHFECLGAFWEEERRNNKVSQGGHLQESILNIDFEGEIDYSLEKLTNGIFGLNSNKRLLLSQRVEKTWKLFCI